MEDARSRTHRALAMLALSLTLATATATVAAAAPSPTAGIEDQNDRLLRNLQAAQAERTGAAVVLARSMERNLGVRR
jgi:ABC-type transporter MlaC component